MKHERALWAVVLAAGEGRRLASLTRALYGRTLPKQFVGFAGARSFLQQTLDRIAPLIPAERTVVVVSAAREKLAREQLAEYQGVEIVVQPADRGTGPGVLLPLAHVRARDPGAEVVVFPSDHDVKRPQALLDAVQAARAAARTSPAGLALIGATADRPASDLGWIEPGPGRDEGARLVRRFVEKPHEHLARELLRAGALWNTFIVAGHASTLWALASEVLPAQVAVMERYVGWIGDPRARAVLEEVYEHMPSADFSQGVLERAVGLAVVPLVQAGWSDCGTPERLVASFAGTRAFEHLRLQLQIAGVL
jgi:mannose-1-phosphate guanylyltransferase